MRLIRIPLSVAAGLLLLLAGDAGLAEQAPELCCACLERKLGTVAGNGDHVVPALFCGEFPTMDVPAEQQRCEELGGSLFCPDFDARTSVSAECRALLAEDSIACPAAAGAPLAGGGMLAALALLLAAGGVRAVRFHTGRRS